MQDVFADRSSRASQTASRLVLVLCVGLWLLFGSTAANAEFTRFQAYGEEQGLGNPDTTTIKQDADGYMLFGTEGGLYRFDGSTITAFGESLGLAPEWIWQIAIDPLNRPWVVARDDIHILRDGKLVRLGDGSLFTDMEAPLLVAFGGGRVVINDGGKLLTAPLTGQDVGPFTPLLDAAMLSHLPQTRRTGFVVTSGHDGFAFACGNAICQLDGTGVSVLDTAAGLPAEPWQTAMVSRNGTFWARSLHHLAWRSSGSSTFSVVDIPDHDSSYFAGGPELLTLAQDDLGRVYTQGGDGLLVWDGATWHAMPHHLLGLTRNPIRALFFDREESLWVGSNDNGVYRSIGLGRWNHWTTEDGLPGDEVWSTTRLPNGQFWTATYNGSGVLGDRSTIIAGANCAVVTTRAGHLWAAPFGSNLIRLDPATGHEDRFGSLGTVRTALVDSRNRLWLSSRGGLVLIADADAPASAIAPQVLLADSTRQAAESPSGEIWAAASDGLFRLGPDNRFHLIVGHDLLHTRVDSLQFTSDGTVWASGGGLGIARFRVDGDHVTVLPMLSRPTLPSNNVVFMFRDRHDAMWVGTDRGLAVLNRGGWHNIDSSTGPISNDLNAYGAFQDTDDSLWFSTTHGLSHLLHPDTLPDLPPLHPIVTGVSLDNRSLPPTPDLHVGAEVGSLSIRFTDLNFARGRDIAFRYRLVGVDRDWNETVAHEVRYGSLPGGELQFQLIAVDTMHRSVSAPIGFVVHVRAPWWRRWWFYVACLACICASIGVVSRLRVRMLTRQRERLLRNRERLEYLVRIRTAEIEHARSELQRLAMTDMLTGLPNRRAIMTTLETSIEQARGAAESIGILLCDIDHFKTINDTWGHQAGDEVLTVFGARLRAAASEAAGRYGGEEFLVILRGPPEHIETLARRILGEVVDEPIAFGDTVQTITVSAGTAILRDGDTVAALIARADAALYKAKRAGRNRLESSERTLESMLPS